MTKYLKQRNNFSCGPIAFLNALIWACPDEKFTYAEHYKQAVEKLKCTREGVSRENMADALLESFPDCTELPELDLGVIREHLLTGGAIVLGHAEVDDCLEATGDGHYSFWFIDFEDTGVWTQPNLFTANFMVGKSQPTLIDLGLEMFQNLQDITKEVLGENLEIYLI